MDTFQIVVLVIATIILILIFATVSILAKYYDTGKIFPPKANTCPDYWRVDGSGNCMIPGSSSMNKGKIFDTSGKTLLTNDKTNTTYIYTPGYKSDDNVIDFNDPFWSTLGKSSICAKKAWANTNKIIWDGVSNYNSCS